MIFHCFCNEKGLFFQGGFRQFTKGTLFKNVSKTCFCNQIESNLSKISFLDATLAEISQGSRVSHLEPHNMSKLG